MTFGQSMLPKNFKGGVMRSSPNLMSKAKSVDKKDVKALENFLGSKPEIEAVYNRPDEIDELLESLVISDYKETFEVVIVEVATVVTVEVAVVLASPI